MLAGKFYEPSGLIGGGVSPAFLGIVTAQPHTVALAPRARQLAALAAKVRHDDARAAAGAAGNGGRGLARLLGHDRQPSRVPSLRASWPPKRHHRE